MVALKSLKNKQILMIVLIFIPVLIVSCLTFLFLPEEDLLKNGSFEEYDAAGRQLVGWRKWAYIWRDSIHNFDEQIKKTGKKSAVLFNQEPDDSAWVQEVDLKPNTRYTLAGWIKTENVADTPEKNNIGASLDVIIPDGVLINRSECIVFGSQGEFTFHTKAMLGTKDWHYVKLIFETRGETRARFQARLGFAFGMCSGKAWFDGIRLTENSFIKSSLFLFVLLCLCIAAALLLVSIFRYKGKNRNKDPIADKEATQAATPQKNVKRKIAVICISTLIPLFLIEVGFRLYNIYQSESFYSTTFTIPPAAENSKFLILGAGESTMKGEPYDEKFNMLEILKYYIEKNDPAAEIAIHNIAYQGLSFDAVYNDVINTLRSKRPSLFVLCAGHNEFLANFNHEKVDLLSASSFYNICKYSDALMFFYKRFQKKTVSHFDVMQERKFFDYPVISDEQKDDLMQAFRKKILTLANLLAKNKVLSVFIFPAGNEASFNPNRSYYRGKENERSHFRKLYNEGRYELAAGNSKEALEKFEKALAIDNTFAELLYRTGLAHVQNGDIDQAKEYFFKAKECDDFPWRALNRQRDAIYEAADKFGIIALDARDILCKASEDGLLSDRIFHDIHHPNSKGYHALGKEIYRSLVQNNIIAGKSAMSDKDFS